MNAATLACSIPASAFRRWRSLRLRTRVALALLAVATLAGSWFFLGGLVDPWPARAVLKTPVETWPLAFSPDGRTFLTSGGEGITRWDVATGRKQGDPWVLRDDQSAIVGEFSPDGRTFAAAGYSGPKSLSIHLIDVVTGRIRASLPVASTSLYALRFADGGRTLKTFLGDAPSLEQVVTWDVDTGREVSRLPLSAPTKTGIAAISADGKTLAVGPRGRSVVELWDLETNRALGSVMNPKSTSAVTWGGVGLTSDGRTLAVAREDGTIELWDVPTRTLRTAHSIGLSASGLRFSPDGRTLAADAHPLPPTSTLGQISHDLRQRLGGKREDQAEVIVLDVVTGRRLAQALRSIHPHYSPDGRTIATRERDLSVKLRDLPDGKEDRR
jgi:WD40 repeat protein